MTDEQLQFEVQDIFLTQDSAEAIRLIRELKSQSVQTDYEKQLLLQLDYIRIASLSKKRLLDLLKNNLPIAYTIPDYDLADKIISYVDQVEIALDQVDVCKSVRLLLENHASRLGQNDIKVKDKTTASTIGNWIADYNSWPVKTSHRDALTEVEYLNKSANVKSLTQEEKEVLKDILKLYDYCFNYETSWNAIPVPANEKEAFKDFDLYNYIPGLEEDLINEKQTTITSVPPVARVVLPKPAEKSSTLEQRRVSQPLPEQPIIELADRKPTESAPKNPVPIAPPPASMSDIAKPGPTRLPTLSRPGVVKDPTNISVDEERHRIQQENMKRIQNIQKKLADLKARKPKS